MPITLNHYLVLSAILFACGGAWIGFNRISIPVFDHWTHFFHLLLMPWFSRWIHLPAIVQLAPSSVAGPPGTQLGWLIFGVLMGVVGILGDLAESLLKRDVGCKD